MTVVTMESIISSVGAFFTAALGWMGQLLETIVGNPVLLIMVVCMPVAGIAIGYLNRLLRG